MTRKTVKCATDEHLMGALLVGAALEPIDKFTLDHRFGAEGPKSLCHIRMKHFNSSLPIPRTTLPLPPEGGRPRPIGFTLIELLIVVAIIAILAAIAVPNFLEAQTRAKVARVKADYHSIAMAIEAYFVDANHYPWLNLAGFDAQYNQISYRLRTLTTPTAYLSTVRYEDPFVIGGTMGNYTDNLPRTQYNYRNYEFVESAPLPAGLKIWVLNSLGPDRVKNQGLNVEYLARGMSTGQAPTVIYDPTNGTVSAGDIARTGGATRYNNP